jgi:hypothetical protein
MNAQARSARHTIYLISGGVGTSGEQLVRTVLAQFPDPEVVLIVVPHIRHAQQLEQVVANAQEKGATLVHTLVDGELRQSLAELCEQRGVFSIDLMGRLFDRLAERLGEQPLGQPGLYRQLHKDYYERVAAIDYTLAHDDGQDPQTWSQADMLLVGVSRVGKTPLSVYLSVLGWKAANYPLVPGIDPPEALSKLDPRRVIGLVIEPGQLISLRRERQRRIGAFGPGAYTDPESVFEEVEFANRFFKRHGFSTLDVTDKPLETTADEVIRLITGRFESSDRHG